MNAAQIRKFYESKEDVKCTLTKKLIESGYQQEKGGYIDYASEYSRNNADDVIEVDYKKASPNQWWHLIRSWCDRSAPSLTFGKSIKCGELYFWMAEVSGAFSECELKSLSEGALKIARKSTKDNRMPLRTVESNIFIRNYCFDRIKNVVENYQE